MTLLSEGHFKVTLLSKGHFKVTLLTFEGYYKVTFTKRFVSSVHSTQILSKCLCHFSGDVIASSLYPLCRSD